jgi:hypothetical protein
MDIDCLIDRRLTADALVADSLAIILLRCCESGYGEEVGGFFMDWSFESIFFRGCVGGGLVG